MNPSVRSVYTPVDFQQWRASDSLSLTPKFQRRSVWKTPARSFFIDTLLRGMPVPPIYIRQTQSQKRDRVIREVVDGQQRVSAVLDFIDEEYRLSRTLKAEWAGKSFSQLSEAERDRIRSYSFSSEVFHGISDLEVLEIFSRLNTYSVPLNAQELRNGRFFGRFKQSVYSLAYEHLEFWRQHNIFTEQRIARMLEAEFVSEVLAAFIEGMQDKKNSLNNFYEAYDETFAQQAQLEKRFRQVVDDITLAIGGDLKETAFRRPPLLYSLFCVIYHRQFGLPNAKIATPKKPLTKDERSSLADAIKVLSEHFETARSEEEEEQVPKAYLAFVNASLSQTDNIRPRQERFSAIYKEAFR
ncbi:MAG: DUF262 domain-containing protein [Gammaproteobacteria bacterium]|nr:DUF262 domain-containing protein [Gammaproteobacteria bacterium]